MKKVFLFFLVITNTVFGQTETKSFIKSKISNEFSLNYILSTPDNVKEYKPLIIFLHGSGERGSDLDKLKIHGPLNYLKSNKLDAYILVPQCPQDKYWNSEELYLLIQKVTQENKIDSSRIYLTGLSMGAWGAWNLAFDHPELFAALVPIAGFVDRVPMVESCEIKNIPIRIFHGLQDDIVSVNYAIAIYDKLKNCHSDIKLEIFEDANHDSWTQVYNNNEIYDWMLQQKKQQYGSRKLIWEENFNGIKLDETTWNYELGNGCPNLCGWGNNEVQIYTKTNHSVKDGFLTIQAKKEENIYSSTRITTKDKKEFQYGRIETRAKLPVGTGLWPAFWMLGANISDVGWPKCGEIDILEYVGKEPNMIFTSLHTKDSHGNTINTKKTKIENIEEGFHVYAIEWDKNKIAFFVDEVLVYTFQPKIQNENTWPYNQPFYFIINLAIGGNFGGPDVNDTIFPQEFIIDYIKVYQ